MDMWKTLENLCGREIPQCIQQILTASGFDNEISFECFNESNIIGVEQYVNKHLRSTINSLTCCYSTFYKAQKVFEFLPGHRNLILQLVEEFRSKRQAYSALACNDISFLERAKNHPAFSYLLQEFVTNSINNFKKKARGCRFTETIHAFSTYIYMLCGRNCYEIICSNLPMPQPSTILNYIQEKKVKITEGELRCKDLCAYLESINAPKTIWLSEDGSGIVPKAVFDTSSNKLIGLDLPIDQITGMPISSSFMARSLQEIEKNMRQPKSTLVYVVMAQPVIKHASPFILQIYGTMNKFKTLDVLNRWKFTISELKKWGITVLGISSDGDWRLLNSMKAKSKFEQNFLLLIDYDLITIEDQCYIQDATHIGTKLRNRMLRLSCLLMFGNKIISVAHLKILLEKVPKDKHGLVYKDVAPDDRQNFASLEKVMRPEVLKALKEHVFDSEATIAYLNICKCVTASTLDPKLKPLERVYKIWYAAFILRIWRNWLLSAENYNLDENFISTNAYDCVEINAMGLIHLIVKLRNIGRSEWFLPTLFDSQPCERTFRQMRSMATQNFTKINFSLSELLHIVQRVELQNDILYNRLAKTEMVFPRIKIETDYDTTVELPSNQELAETIKKAMDDAKKCAHEFGMNSETFDAAKCPVKKPFVLSCGKNQNDTSSEEEIPEETSIINRTNSLSLPEYDREKVSLGEDSKFIEVCFDDGFTQIVRKSSIVWLLTESLQKLSSDRLRRVQATPKETLTLPKRAKKTESISSSKSCSNNDAYKCENIKIGDCCVFQFDFDNNSLIDSSIEYGVENVIIGIIVAFRYSGGKTAKERLYRNDMAPIRKKNENDKSLQALSNWYTVKKDGHLNCLMNGSNSFFVDFEKYICTIETLKVNVEKKEISLPMSVDQLKSFL